MAKAGRIQSYEEFFDFYLSQHSLPSNRTLHFIGTTAGLAIAIWAFASGHPWRAFWFLPVAYGFAWTGHFFLEKNRPATFEYPWWSFISDFRMIGLMLTGRLQARMKGATPNS